MKILNRTSNFSPIIKAVFIPAILISCLPCFGQVIIESGHFGVQHSNRDGRIVVPATSRYGQVITVPNPAPPVAPVIRSNSTLRNPPPVANLIPSTGTNQVRPRTALPYTATSTAPVTTESLRRAELAARETQRPRPTPQPRVIDVNRIQQINRMERELSVIKTNKVAWMEFDANLIFNRGNKTIKKSAIPLLQKVLAYRCIACGKSISVDYRYVSQGDCAEMALARSASLVEYLSKKSGLSIGCFSIQEPKPILKRAYAGQTFPGELHRPYKSVVNIRIMRSDS